MFRIGASKECTNPAMALAGESGTFLVWGPSGAVERYECPNGRSIISIEFVERRPPRSEYLITKIAEEMAAASEFNATTTRAAREAAFGGGAPRT
jgi:hypothetical protein